MTEPTELAAAAEQQAALSTLAASIEATNTGVSFFGGGTKYAGIEIAHYGPELAFLFVAQVYIFVKMLGKLNGRFLRMNQFVHSLDFAILGNGVKSQPAVVYLTIVGYSYLVFPFITLIIWVVELIRDAGKNDAPLDSTNGVFMGSMSVLLLGFALFLVVIATTKISWNNYRFKMSHTLVFAFAYALLTIWQFMTIFSSIRDDFNFQAIAVVFLTQSGMIMCVIVYLNLYENKFNLIYFLNKFMAKGDRENAPDPKRTNNLLQEIDEQKTNDDYQPTMWDIFDIITIGKISSKKMMNAFGRGFATLVFNRTPMIRLTINIILFVLYGGVLALFSWMVFDRDNESKLGLVSSIAVVINDLYMYMMYNGRIISRISVLSLMVFASRAFILLGGSDNWYYGYLVIFVWLECIIATGIVAKRFPLNTEIDTEQDSNSVANIKKTKFQDLARVPEFIFILIVISLIVSIVVATSFEPDGVYLVDLPIGDGISYEAATALAILFVITFLILASWARVFRRRIDRTVSPTYVYLCSKTIDIFYIMTGILYVICAFWTLGIYSYWESKIILCTGFIVPAIIFLYFNVVVIYVKNNFHFIESAAEINKRISASNKRVDALKAKAIELRKTILEKGAGAVYGEDNARLVKKVMELEVQRRETAKLAAKARQSGVKKPDDSDDDGNMKRQATFGRSILSPTNQNKKATQIVPNNESPSNHADPFAAADATDNQNQTGNNQLLEGDDGQLVSQKTPFNQKLNMAGTMSGFKLDDDSSEEDVDAIPDEMKAYLPTRIDKKRKHIKSWRADGMGYIGAFFKGRMRSNDYGVVWSIIIMCVLIVVYTVTAAAVTDDAIGLMFGVTVLHVVTLSLSMMNNIVANRPANLADRIAGVCAFVLIYVASLVYLFVVFDTSLMGMDEDDLTAEQLIERNSARDFVTGELIVIPFITAFIAILMKAYRDNTNGRKMTTGFWMFLVINFIQAIALVVVMFLYLGSGLAIITLIVLGVLILGFVQYVLRIKYSNKPLKISEKIKISTYTLEKIWNTFNIVAFVGVILAVVIYLSNHDEIPSYAAITSLFMMIIFMLALLTLATFVADRTRMDDMPIYHSPWIFPIYKYYPKNNDISPHESAVSFFFITCFVGIMWSLWTAVEISPSWLGTGFTCLIEALFVIVSLYFINTNNLQYKKVRPFVDALVIKQAWLDSKLNLAKMLQIDDRASYNSYETWWRRRRNLRNYMLIWQSKSVLKWPESDEFQMEKREFENQADKGAWLREKLETWVDPDECDLSNWADCQKFLFETDKDVRAAYLAELETVIQFQLIILQNAQALRENERSYLFKFIKEKRSELYLIGINFELASSDSQSVKYNACLGEIKKLPADKATLFNALKENYIEEERQKHIDELAAEQKEQAAAEERLDALAKMSDARRLALEEMLKNPNMPIADMPDCKVKLDKIREKVKQDHQKFTDTQFSHENPDQVLGERIAPAPSQRLIEGWKRASEMPGAKLFIDGASHEDITQGALGDCYFLSALSVLGNQRTVELFVCQEDSNHENEADPNHWKQTGAFMVKFFRDGNFQYVIVDDWLPIRYDGQPAFTRGGPDGLEIWPAILEKAYAKLYGSYSAIEAGKVHLALADLVENGFPEQLALKSFKNNVKSFAQRMRKLDANQALMGAGSPEGEDTNVNEEGIVQGHAYAILDVADYQGQQLIQLRNPHGKADHTSEWNGDWADDSDRWTRKSKAALKYEPNEQVDGVFWMPNRDFLTNYKYVYLCRELTQKAGWYVKEQLSQWQGPSSAGFPGRLRSVPQFKLTITNPGPGFISMTQDGGAGSSFKGKNFIGWMAARNEGKVMSKLNKRTIITKAGISDLKTLSSEIDFDEKVIYPYSFTIICGSKNAGPAGEGNFELKVYSRDANMKLEKLNYV